MISVIRNTQTQQLARNLLIYIRDVPGTKRGRDTESAKVRVVLLSHFRADSVVTLQSRPGGSYLFASFAYHCLMLTRRFGAVRPELLAASLCKPRTVHVCSFVYLKLVSALNISFCYKQVLICTGVACWWVGWLGMHDCRVGRKTSVGWKWRNRKTNKRDK